VKIKIKLTTITEYVRRNLSLIKKYLSTSIQKVTIMKLLSINIESIQNIILNQFIESNNCQKQFKRAITRSPGSPGLVYFYRFRFKNSTLKHEFYKSYIKARVRFAARLPQAGLPVNNESSYVL
jgi:hypothetical protein